MNLKDFTDALLAKYPPDVEVVIRDADTDWIGPNIRHDIESDGRLHLYISYGEME